MIGEPSASRGPGRKAAALAVVRAAAQRLTLDRQIEFWLQEIDPRWSLHTLRARVLDVIAETHDVKTFVLAPNGLWPGHRAGQFVTVDVEIEGVRVTRCYSLSSPPGDGRIAITIKRVPGGRVSSWMHDRVGRGDVLDLGMPTGEFVLAAPPPRLLLVSGGSGVTPIMSVLRDLGRRGAIDDVVFIHAARSRRDVVFARELEAMAVRHAGLRVALYLESDGARLDRDELCARVPDLAEREAMLCGPPGMMEALAPTWTESGLAHRLKVERFAPSSGGRLVGAPEAARAPAKVKLSLVHSGRSVPAEGTETLLEQLERGGERPAHGCRMGICNTCLCRKRAGVVEDLVTGEISSEPDQDIRLCTSRARSDLELAL